jgi:hypothetical protein
MKFRELVAAPLWPPLSGRAVTTAEHLLHVVDETVYLQVDMVLSVLQGTSFCHTAVLQTVGTGGIRAIQ